MVDLGQLAAKFQRKRAPHAGEVVYAVGDIHGCYEQLIELLERVAVDLNESEFRRNATLIFLGDYVDRGPATSAVLAGMVWLERHAPVQTVFLKGNHEQVMLDYIDDPVRHKAWLQFGGVATLRSYGVAVPDDLDAVDIVDTRDRLVDLIPSSHLDFLRRLRLFFETQDYVFVHAGVQPGVPMSKQEPEDLLWIREGFLEEQAPGRKLVVHGHTWVGSMPEVLAHRIGVDTGAYETGVLTAARLYGAVIDFLSTAHPLIEGKDMMATSTTRSG